MGNTLKPVILLSTMNIGSIVESGKMNTLYTLNESGEFSSLEIDNSGSISLHTLIKGFPPSPGDSIHSDPANNFLWQVRGRGLYFLDISTMQTKHIISSYNFNDEVGSVSIISPEKKLLYVWLMNHGIDDPESFSFVIIDFNRGEIVFESYLIAGGLFPLNDSKALFQEYTGDQGNIIKWSLTDYSLENIQDNKLTKQLSQLQIDVWPYSKVYHREKRIMLGYSRMTGTIEYFSITWDEDFEDIHSEPIIIQRPGGKRIGADFQFSANGDWVKTLLTEKSGPIDTPRLLFYHVHDMYPQHLSQPILCGYTNRENPGAFMDHEKWGPCYVEQDPDYPKKIFVYKLNEGLKLLADQVVTRATR
ncbi:MAG: hypothetical protein JXB88_16645 [Spirochaetales bacterium]|nr:hypothetical protein [Spirochaetales bacterium]